MAKRQDADPKPPPTRREKAAEARRKARLKRDTQREMDHRQAQSSISVAELAARQGVTLRRMQILVQEILARRAPSPPAEYLALQVNRLNEAMIVAYGSMAGGNLKAVDRVLRIVSEMDRYHGFFPRRARAPVNRRRLALPAQEPHALAPPPEAGAGWKSRCNRLKRLNSAMEIDRAPQPERGTEITVLSGPGHMPAISSRASASRSRRHAGICRPIAGGRSASATGPNGRRSSASTSGPCRSAATHLAQPSRACPAGHHQERRQQSHECEGRRGCERYPVGGAQARGTLGCRGRGSSEARSGNSFSADRAGKVEDVAGAVQRLPVPRSSEYPAFRRGHWAMGRPSVR